MRFKTFLFVVSSALAVFWGAGPAMAQRQPPIPAGCNAVTYADVVALDQPWSWNRYGAVEPQGMMYALRRDVVPTSRCRRPAGPRRDLYPEPRARWRCAATSGRARWCCGSTPATACTSTSPTCCRRRCRATRTSSRRPAPPPCTSSAWRPPVDRRHGRPTSARTRPPATASSIRANEHRLLAVRPQGGDLHLLQRRRHDRRRGGQRQHLRGSLRRRQRRARGLRVVPQPGDARRPQPRPHRPDISATTDSFPKINYDAVYPSDPPLRQPARADDEEGQRDRPLRSDGDHRGSGSGLPAERHDRAPRSTPTGISRSASSPSSSTTRSGPCRRSPSSRPTISTSPCTACATPSRSTTAPAASAPRSWPTASAWGRPATARSASTRSSSSPPGRWAIRPWWSTGRPTRPAPRRRSRPAHLGCYTGRGRRPPRRLLSGRSVERLPQLHGRSRQVPQHARRAATITTSSTCTPTSGCTRRYSDTVVLQGQPVDRPGRGLHLRDRLRRQRQPQQDGGRFDLPLPFLSALRAGHVEPLAGARRAGARHPAGRATGGRPRGSRALPDSEIAAGTPIPAIVPIPMLAMAPLPGPVEINNATGQVVAAGDGDRQPRLSVLRSRPGRPPAAPSAAGLRRLDTATSIDGGLPRHIVTDGAATSAADPLQLREEADRPGQRRSGSPRAASRSSRWR